MEFSSDLNQFIAVTQPWALNKRGETQALESVMYTLLEGVRWLAVMLCAFLPNTSDLILSGLGVESKTFESLRWGGLKSGESLKNIEVLFAKMELPVKEEVKEEPKKEAKKEEPKAAEEGIITFDHFMAVELKVGHILSAEKVEGADKLLKLSVDAGEESPRTVVAGIAKSYAPEDLVDQRVAMVANLKPRKVFGTLSQGMLLAVETEDGGLELARYSANVKAGTRIS